MSGNAAKIVAVGLSLGWLLVCAGSVGAQPVPPVSPSQTETGKDDLSDPPKPARGKYEIDSDRLAFRYVRDDAPIQHEGQNQQEFDAYNEVLLFARQFSAAELEANAKKDLTFLDLVKPVRADYQFKLVYFTGRLKRLRELVPTKPLAAVGVTALYEGWVFPTNGTDPMCVLVSELPPGIATGQDFNPSLPVGFAGYSFKLMRYESAEPDPKNPGQTKVRRAPLILGRTITPLPEGDPNDTPSRPWKETFLPIMLGSVAGVGLIGLGVTWYFRRGDRAVRLALQERTDRNPFTGGPDPASDGVVSH